MLIKKIKLRNFRQYKDVQLALSTNPDKNLTVILGENGYGKTTLIRAFLWCLYRDNGFSDRILLNNDVAQEMKDDDEKKVLVQIDLDHAGFDYRITTEEIYKKCEGIISVSKKASTSVLQDGKPIPATKVDMTISKILKKELKDYFFYDGENNKIETAAKKGALKDAVSQMMGIHRIEQLRNCFNENYKLSVQKTLRDQLTGDNLEIVPLHNQIDELTNDKNKRLMLVEKNKKTIEALEAKILEKENIINANMSVKEDQDSKISLDKDIIKDQENVDIDYQNMISQISQKKTTPFLNVLFAKCFNKYDFASYKEKSVFGDFKDSLSHISEEAIDQIINRGYCLCGTKIENGNDAHMNLLKSKDHMEPHDFGKYLNDFITAETSNYDISYELTDNIINKSNCLNDRIERIENNKELRDEIIKRIADRPDIGEFQIEVNTMKSQIYNLKGQNNYILNEEIKDIDGKVEKLAKKIESLAIQNEENQLIKKCLHYARVIYKEANKMVTNRQKATRNLLQDVVSDIFEKMYHGDRKLEITENFDIITLTNNVTLDNSTGTETVKNFAFVAGLLKSIKTIIGDENSDEMSGSEVYPLVMDAPFSDTDAEHIKNICMTLPKYCEQLCIVVIKKDYDVAYEGIKNKIGKLYQITKHSETDDTIEEVDLNV